MTLELAWIGVVALIAIGLSGAHALLERQFNAFVPPLLGEVYRSNCALFAIAMWWQFGGYVSLRRSDYWWGPHVVWSLDLVTFYDFTPVDTKRHRIVPPWRFLGSVQRWKGRERLT